MSDISNDVISLPDIPLPSANQLEPRVTDTFTSAVKMCFIGSGQGGSRLAESFYRLGYRRVCAINSTVADLDTISIPAENKRAIENRGAAKDLELGRRYAENAKEDILDLLRRSFDTDFDRIMICVGAGGGTGAGSVETLIKIAQDYCDACGVPRKVGVIVALPQLSEGQKPNRNASIVLKSLLTSAGVYGGPQTISPLIIVDNQRIQKIYPNVPVANFWTVANQSICSLFHLFNMLANKESSFTTFDKQDYVDLLDSGVLSLGASPLPNKPKDATEISLALRNNLSNNLLAGGFDLKTGKKAGCIFVGGEEVLNEMPRHFLDHGFDMINRLLSDTGSVIHQGVYRGDKPGLATYTIVAGLGEPAARLKEMKTAGGLVDFDEVH